MHVNDAGRSKYVTADPPKVHSPSDRIEGGSATAVRFAQPCRACFPKNSKVEPKDKEVMLQPLEKAPVIKYFTGSRLSETKPVKPDNELPWTTSIVEGKAISVTNDCPPDDDKDFTPSGMYIVPLHEPRLVTSVPFNVLVI